MQNISLQLDSPILSLPRHNFNLSLIEKMKSYAGQVNLRNQFYDDWGKLKDISTMLIHSHKKSRQSLVSYELLRNLITTIPGYSTNELSSLVEKIESMMKKDSYYQACSYISKQLIAVKTALFKVCNDKSPQLGSHIKQIEFKLQGKTIIGVYGEIWYERIRTLKIILTPSVVLIESPQLFISVTMSYNLFLSWADLFELRANALMANTVFNECGFSTGLTNDNIVHILNLGDELIKLYGNKGFKIIKELESLFVAYFIDSCDYARLRIDDNVFLNEMKRTIQDLDSETDISAKIFEFLQNPAFNKRTYLELSGLFRLWGHPIIDPIQGLSKIREIGQIIEDIDTTFIEELKGDLVFTAIQHYYQKHRQLPNFQITGTLTEDHRAMLFPLLSQRLPTLINHPKFYEAYSHVKLEPYWNPDVILPDPKGLMDDKSCSKSVSEIQEEYESGRRDYSVKVLNRFLEYPWINLPAFLRECDSKELLLDEDDRIILLKPKERELNLEGRMFAVMSFPMRLYTTATEHLVAHKILPMFKEITMVHSYTELHTYLMDVAPVYTGLQNEITIAIHLDLSKWNTHQRFESTAPYFSVLDNLFGYERLYTNFHKMISASKIIYADGSKVNPLVATDRMLIDHKGGMEGIRQKPWTIGGALTLRRLGRDSGLPFNLILQGDNQILIIKRPLITQVGSVERQIELDSLKTKVKEWMDNLKTYCGKLGQHTKLEETWTSVNVLYYGKIPYVDGLLQATSLKKASRMTFVTNDINKSIVNSIGAITTTALSIYQMTGSKLGSLLLAWLKTAELLLQSLDFHPLLNRVNYLKKELSKFGINDILLDVMTRPTILGGFGGIYPSLLEVRAFPDALTQALAGILISTKVCNLRMRNILFSQSNPVMSRRGLTAQTEKRLIEAPDSINILSSDTFIGVARNVVERYIRQRLRTHIQNIEFIEYFEGETTSKQMFLQSFLDHDNMFPRLNSFIYSLSDHGFSEAYLNKFVNTRTFREESFAQDKSIYRKLVDAEEKLWMVLIKHHTQPALPFTCATQRAIDIRRESWGRDLYGVTVPYPSCFLKRTHNHTEYPDPWLNDYMTMEIDNSVSGGFKPYLGSSTRENKVTLSSAEADLLTPLTKQIIQLWGIMGWFVSCSESNLNNFRKFVASRVGEELDIPPPVKSLSGDPIHRFRHNRVSSGSFVSFPPHISRRYNINTSTMVHTGRGGANYVLLFQAAMIYMMDNEHSLNNSVDHVIYQIGCEGCKISTTMGELQLPDMNYVVSMPAFQINIPDRDPLPISSEGPISKEANIEYLKLEFSSCGKKALAIEYKAEAEMLTMVLIASSLISHKGLFIRPFIEHNVNTGRILGALEDLWDMGTSLYALLCYKVETKDKVFDMMNFIDYLKTFQFKVSSRAVECLIMANDPVVTSSGLSLESIRGKLQERLRLKLTNVTSDSISRLKQLPTVFWIQGAGKKHDWTNLYNTLSWAFDISITELAVYEYDVNTIIKEIMVPAKMIQIPSSTTTGSLNLNLSITSQPFILEPPLINICLEAIIPELLHDINVPKDFTLTGNFNYVLWVLLHKPPINFKYGGQEWIEQNPVPGYQLLSDYTVSNQVQRVVHVLESGENLTKVSRLLDEVEECVLVITASAKTGVSSVMETLETLCNNKLFIEKAVASPTCAVVCIKMTRTSTIMLRRWPVLPAPTFFSTNLMWALGKVQSHKLNNPKLHLPIFSGAPLRSKSFKLISHIMTLINRSWRIENYENLQYSASAITPISFWLLSQIHINPNLIDSILDVDFLIVTKRNKPTSKAPWLIEYSFDPLSHEFGSTIMITKEELYNWLRTHLVELHKIFSIFWNQAAFWASLNESLLTRIKISLED